MPSRDDDRYREDQPEPTRRRRRPEIDDDDRPRRRGNKGGGGTILIILALVAVLVLGCVGLSGVGLYFAVGKVREASQNAVGKVRDASQNQESSNNLKQIGLAIHNHHDVNGYFPPPYLKTKDGKPGLSWRVAILPWLEQDSLYRQFKLDEPWDSPSNRQLLSRMPRTYAPPGQKDLTVTHYRVFVGPGTMFDPNKSKIRIVDVKDGLSNTLMVVEARDPVEWTKPDVLVFTPTTTLAPLLMWRNGRANILMGDSFAMPISQQIGEPMLRNLITIDDGNQIVLP